MACTRDRTTMDTKLSLISRVAEGDKKARINNVAYLLDVANLRESYDQLKRGKAVGVDGMSLEEYGKDLEGNLQNLVERLKKGSYKPQPVRRTYIPKANGKMRPLGIPTIEDKIVQHGIARILSAIYEVDFLDFSYGFRPNRNCHQALLRLDRMVMTKPVNYIIDADIKGYFDNVSHEWMLKFLAHRINEPRLLKLLGKFLKAGYLEDGILFATEKGTPQGGIISPVLANVYLHYVLDLWFDRRVRKACRGFVDMVRYADDFIICAEYQEDAKLILELLHARLEVFCLELAADKTRIIEFGRGAYVTAKREGKRLETFNFLGFTHYAGKSRKGNFLLGRKTEGKKLRAKLKEITLWLIKIRNTAKVQEWWGTLRAKLTGHFRYYGVSGNTQYINVFYRLVLRSVHKWLNRRSQQSSFNWEEFKKYVARHPIGEPKIYHNFYLNFR
jgi:RNA-directed DNA polymerase